VGRRQHAGKSGSSLVRADVRYTSTDLQIYLPLVERGLVREAACTYRWLAIDVSGARPPRESQPMPHPQPPSQDHETSRLGL
jgi:hypothetical protein